jgi:hypothetical protein
MSTCNYEVKTLTYRTGKCQKKIITEQQRAHEATYKNAGQS